MSTLESIVEELRALPAPRLEAAASFIHRLREVSEAGRIAALEYTAGAWSGPDGAAMEKSIEEGCQRVDPRDW